VNRPAAIGHTAADRGGIAQLADHLFRHETGKLVSVLTGIFGIDRLQLAEDVVQESLVKAMQTWPYYGVPKNPAAWLTQTAKHLALDVIRREKLFSEKQPQIIAFVEQWASACAPEDAPAFEDEIKDRQLQLMFACCHPLIPQEAQIALALKTLCGFSPAEIAHAFLTTEAAIAKRLVRARQKIRELNVPHDASTDRSSQNSPRMLVLMLVLMVTHLGRRGIKPFLARNKLPPLRQEFNQRFRCHILGGTGEKSRFRPEPIDDRLAQGFASVSAAGIQHHLHHLVTMDLSIVVHCHHFRIRTLPRSRSLCQPRTAKPLTSLKPPKGRRRSLELAINAEKPAPGPRRCRRPAAATPARSASSRQQFLPITRTAHVTDSISAHTV
jgi:RNA polymerase sigma factor (sigma-70 family)